MDACWHHFIEVDPAKHEATRRKQMVQLARYGRMGGDPRVWEDVPVDEFRAYYAALAEVLEEENAMGRHQENR